MFELTKWSPFDSKSLLSRVDDLFKDPFFGDVATPTRWHPEWMAPAADIVETENALELRVDLPGHDPKGIQVKLEGDTLTIQSERKSEKNEQGRTYLRSERTYGAFARSFVLPATVDGQRCEARYENGVLTMTLPKRDEAKPRRIDIKVQT